MQEESLMHLEIYPKLEEITPLDDEDFAQLRDITTTYFEQGMICRTDILCYAYYVLDGPDIFGIELDSDAMIPAGRTSGGRFLTSLITSLLRDGEHIEHMDLGNLILGGDGFSIRPGVVYFTNLRIIALGEYRRFNDPSLTYYYLLYPTEDGGWTPKRGMDLIELDDISKVKGSYDEITFKYDTTYLKESARMLLGPLFFKTSLGRTKSVKQKKIKVQYSLDRTFKGGLPDLPLLLKRHKKILEILKRKR